MHRTFLSALFCAFAMVAFAADGAAEKDTAAQLGAPKNRWLIQTSVCP